MVYGLPYVFHIRYPYDIIAQSYIKSTEPMILISTVKYFAILVVAATIAYGWSSRRILGRETKVCQEQAAANEKEFTMVSKGARIVAQMSVTSDAVVSKKHKNKYEHMSKKAVDPLAVALKVAQDETTRKEEETRRSGTTLPISQGSNNVNIKQNTNLVSKLQQNNSFVPKQFDVKGVIPSDPSTFGYTEIGRIIGPHGVKGEIKIELNTDLAEFRIRNNTVLYIKKPNRRSPRAVKLLQSRKMQQDIYLIFLEGVKSRLTASLLQKYVIYVRSDDRPVLEDEEYLLRDLVGLKCYSSLQDVSTGQAFAKVEGVVPPDELVDPALRNIMHSMLELQLRDSKKYCLVPFVPSIVTHVLIAENSLVIDTPKGLLDLTYELEEKFIIRGYLPTRVAWLSDRDRMLLMQNSIRLFPDGGIVVNAW